MPRSIGRRKPNPKQRPRQNLKPNPKPKRPKQSPKGNPRQDPRGRPGKNIVPTKKESKVPSFGKIDEIDIGKIVPNPKQPRKEFGGFDKMKELARSIEQEGLIQPIIVRKMKKGNKFEIVVGERRWRACKASGIRKIPAIVRNVNDHHLMLQSLIENLHRSDLTAIERENAVYELWKSGKYKTKRALANDLGYSESSINELIEAKEFRTKNTSAAEVSTKVIAQTRGIKDDELRAQVIQKIHDDQITSDEVREFVKLIKTTPGGKQVELLGKSYKIDDEHQDIIEDEDHEDQQELEKENTFITQIQFLQKTVDEVVSLDTNIIRALNTKDKKDLKAKLGAIAEKLDVVIKRL